MDAQPYAESTGSSLHDKAPLPIVGIGASAGGLPALVRLLVSMPPTPGMAMVDVLHLPQGAPDVAPTGCPHTPAACQLVQVRGRMRVQADHVYAPAQELANSVR